MKVLVTGSQGYIGQIVCQALIDAGHTPRRFDNYSTCQEFGHTLRRDDVRDRDVVDGAMAGMDAVIHLAAQASTTAKPWELYSNNVSGTINVLDAMVKHNVNKLIMASSAAVYDPKINSSRWEDDIPEDMTDLTSYGQTKLLTERIAADYRMHHGIDYLAFRFFNVAGATDKFGESRKVETHLIPNLLKAVISGKPCEIHNPHAVRDYVHVRDVARAHIKGLELLSAGSHAQVMNISTDQGHSILQVLDLVSQIAGEVPHKLTKKRSSLDPDHLVGTNASAEMLLDWEPSLDLTAIIESAWAWENRS